MSDTIKTGFITDFSKSMGISPGQRPDKERLTAEFFYWFGIPLGLGLMLGWHGVGSIDFATRLLVVGYWCAFICLSWFGIIFGTWVAYVIFKPWQPPPLFLWLAGPIAFGLLNLLPMNAMVIWGINNLPDGAMNVGPIQLSNFGSFSFWMAYISATTPGAILFASLNFGYERLLGIPRYRYRQQGSHSQSEIDSEQKESPQPNEPEFLRKASTEVRRGELMCVTAQEHYIQVTTTTGKELIRYTFADALEDLKHHSGLRTHRSHWVATSAIRDFSKNKSSFFILLNDDSRIPVSRTYLLDVRQHFEN